MEKVSISRWQFFLVVFQVTLSNSMILLSNRIVAAGGRDAWIIPLLAGAAGIVMAMIWIWLSKRHEGQSIVQIAEATLGKAGWLVALLYVLFFLYIASWTLKNLGDIVNITMLPTTQPWIFQGIFVLIAVYAITLGFTAIARAIEFFVPFIILAFLIVFLVAGYEWEWEQFMPAFLTGAGHLLTGSQAMIAFPFMETVCVTMLLPLRSEKGGRTMLTALACASLILSYLVALSIAVLGVSRSANLTYPLYTIAQELSISVFIEHLEAVVSMLWFLSLFAKIVVFCYCGVIGLCQLLRIRSRGVAGLSIVLYVTGIANALTNNVVENKVWTAKYAFPVNSLFALVFPLLLLAVSLLRGKPKGGAVS